MSTRIAATDPDKQIAAWANAPGVAGITVKGVKLLEAESPPTRKKDLHASCFVPPNAFLVGIETISVNAAKSMRSTMGRKASQRAAVCGLLGRHLDILVPFSQAFHAGRPIVVKLARLGGRGLDGDNLQGSMKFVRDSVCDLIGANDKSPLIHWVYEQLPSERIGVRVMLEEVCDNS